MQVGPYRVVAPLGQGGMGNTFVAERTTQGGTQRVCLKQVRMDAESDPSWPEMFRAEARTVAMLHHPNIVALRDFGCDAGAWWMALELVEGQDLAALVRQRRASATPFPVEVAVHVGIVLAEALGHAHGRSVVHRDVSPGNVLVGREGTVHLTDFGVAKVAHGPRTRTGQLRGKYPYMAPEQLTRRPVDQRTDVFALGIVLFELVAGHRPFDGPTDLATQMNIAEGLRPPLDAVRADVPKRLVTMIHAMLQVRPERRPSSVDVVREGLGRIPVTTDVVPVLGAMATASAER